MTNKKINNVKRWTSIIFISFVFFANCVPYTKRARKDYVVRIAMLCGVDRVSVSGVRDKKIHNHYRVSLKDRFPLYFNSRNGVVGINNQYYRGNLEIRQIGGQIWVINIVDIEDYLKGVVPCEIGGISKNLIEAAKAQAVAARTYAYAHLNQHQDLGFDLYATIQDQVYQGISCETELTSIAVEQTKRQILTYRNRAIEAKYHSTCGGITADFNDAWAGDAPPYLRSVRCPYCKDSPFYTWEKVLSKKQFFTNIRTRLKRIGKEIPSDELIKKIKLMKNKRSRRVNKLIIRTEKNEYVIPGYHVRVVLGDNNDPGGSLKSNYITIKTQGDKVIIEGQGFGHGVGMCQFGAMEMARKGKDYRKILRHYYRASKIKKIR